MAARGSTALRVVVIVAAGLLLGTVVAPLRWHALHWVVYLPMFWALHRGTPRRNRWLLLLYGTVAEGAIFSWIAETITLFSSLPGVVAYLVLGLFAVVYGLPYLFTFALVHPLRDRLGSLWIVALPAWLVVVEWIASSLLLFPYQQGVSQYSFLPTWQLASVTGVAGLSFLVVSWNCALAEWIYRHREDRRGPAGWTLLMGLAVLGVAAWGGLRLQRLRPQLDAAPVLRVHQVQTDKSMTYRLTHPAREAFMYWVEATAALEPGSVDLVVWPEGAVPYDLNTSSQATGMLWELVQRGDFDLIAGSGTREREADPAMEDVGRVRMFNSTYLFDRRAIAADPDVPDPAGSYAALEGAGCDLDAHHVVTPAEARALSAAGEEAGGDPACLDALVARERALRDASAVPDAFWDAVTGDLETWRALRTQTRRFDAPLREAMFRGQGGVGVWKGEDPGCTDGDCAYVAVQCRSTDCRVVRDAPHYDKMVPLPFGEYLPFADTFPWLADLVQGPGNFRAGRDPVVFETGSVRFATPICYEAILGHVCRRFEDPDLFVNVTNDAWFGDTKASDLHGMLVAIRAIELGVPVVRSAYAGVSFTVDVTGAIDHETELFTAVSEVVEVPMLTVDTFYRRWGDWFTALCAALLVGLFGWARRRDVEG